MDRTVSPTTGRNEDHVHGRRTPLVGRDIAHLAKATTKKGTRAGKAVEKPEHGFEDQLTVAAGQLIVKGKEQAYLTPDDIL